MTKIFSETKRGEEIWFIINWNKNVILVKYQSNEITILI